MPRVILAVSIDNMAFGVCCENIRCCEMLQGLPRYVISLMIRYMDEYKYRPRDLARALDNLSNMDDEYLESLGVPKRCIGRFRKYWIPEIKSVLNSDPCRMYEIIKGRFGGMI